MRSYSRRELYALGETLGDSVTQNKLGGGRIYGGGGGGGSQPTQNTTVNTNIPEYAEPYVQTMLGATQEQLFNMDGDKITGFKEYKPYSTDPTQYFAGPSSLQTQAYNQAGQLQTPSQFGLGTGLAGMAAMGQMGAGRQYQRMATDPNAISSYMNPYTQNVIDVQKQAAIRDYQKAMPELQAQAARQGAFGGSRSAIQQAEAQRTLGTNLANIQAQGQQSAYDKALQNMQFGSNLGLQGLAGAASTAGTLGQLGASQQAADVQNINLQNQLGSQQQAYQQNIINQAIQDYATQQQYPLMQLGFMSNMLRGLPMQASTTQQYQAQPSGAQQALGLGLGALGAYKAFA